MLLQRQISTNKRAQEQRWKQSFCTRTISGLLLKVPSYKQRMRSHLHNLKLLSCNKTAITQLQPCNLGQNRTEFFPGFPRHSTNPSLSPDPALNLRLIPCYQKTLIVGPAVLPSSFRRSQEAHAALNR